MFFQFDMSAAGSPTVESASASATEVHDLLRQMLEVQREQLAHLRAFLGAHDGGARWRAFLERWRQDFADLPQACRQALPILERSYGKLIAELTEQLCQDGPLRRGRLAERIRVTGRQRTLETLPSPVPHSGSRGRRLW
jgi:hypothetical protein